MKQLLFLLLMTILAAGQSKSCPLPVITNSGISNGTVIDNPKLEPRCYASAVVTIHPGVTKNLSINGVLMPDVDCSGKKCVIQKLPTVQKIVTAPAATKEK